MLRKILKEETKEIHKYVENSPIMAKIITNQVSQEEYLIYLKQIYPIYQVLENHPLFKGLEWEISLSDKCYQDISSISVYSNNFEETKITKIYCQYLEKIDSLEAIIAHSYVRYMADLMGGQIIKKKIQEWLPTNVYQIENSSSIKKKIIDSIESLGDNSWKLLKAEVHLAFLFYSSILEKC